MNDILAALFLGFSFGNLWLCVLLVLSLNTLNRAACAGYLVGRAMAILALSLVVAAVGSVMNLDRSLLNTLSGIMILGFSFYLLMTRVLNMSPFWKKKTVPDGPGCDGGCETCPVHGHEILNTACSSCPDGGVCEAEETEVRHIAFQARSDRGRNPVGEHGNGLIAGIGLGAVRGAAFCAKLAVLVPIMAGSSVLKALSTALVFTIASSVYPIFGFIMGSAALKLLPFKRWLFGLSTAVLAVLGVIYLYRGVISFV